MLTLSYDLSKLRVCVSVCACVSLCVQSYPASVGGGGVDWVYNRLHTCRQGVCVLILSDRWLLLDLIFMLHWLLIPLTPIT